MFACLRWPAIVSRRASINKVALRMQEHHTLNVRTLQLRANAANASRAHVVNDHYQHPASSLKSSLVAGQSSK
jgi:hypothetical protein